jgi:hypothetical protein
LIFNQEANQMKRSLVIIIGVIVLGGVLAAAWYLASPLFINRVVDEPFPVSVPGPEEMAEMSEGELKDLEAAYLDALPPADQIAEMPEKEREELEEKGMQIASAMPDHTVSEAMPTMENPPTATQPPEPTRRVTQTSVSPTTAPQPTATVPAEPVLLLKGAFYGVDEIHHGTGDALIYETPDGGRLLRLENFEVANGPQLHVILGVEPNPYNHATLGDYLDLGPLKGNIGDQNYEIPPGTDLEDYGSVVIYCVPFRAIFAIAPIK